MIERSPRWSRTLATGIALAIESLIGAMFVSSQVKAAEANGAAESAAPVVMEKAAVTLELVCRDGATEGEFQPIRARMLEATTWGGSQQSHADLTGYSGVPGRRGGGKKATPKKRA